MATSVTRRTFVWSSFAGASALALAACSKPSSDGGDTKASAKKTVAIVCTSAGKSDGGYNQKAIEATQTIANAKGWTVKVVEPTNGIPQALEQLGEDGYSLVFNMEYDFAALIDGTGGAKPLAEQYPDTTWVVFNDNPNVTKDGKVKHKNVISVLFDMNESSFIAGALTVLVNEKASELFGTSGYNFTPADKGGRAVGFIGGTNSNGITVFSYGYIAGINHIAQKLNVSYDFYAKYDAGFTDSATGSTVAGTYYGNGANIVFGVAGSVGDGITSKAKELGKLAIQVDANKDDQQPGYVLTSVLKDTTVPVTSICTMLAEDTLTSAENVQTYSLGSGATDITDLSTITKAIQPNAQATWNAIVEQITALKKEVGTSITVVNAQMGESFDPKKYPNVVIK